MDGSEYISTSVMRSAAGPTALRMSGGRGGRVRCSAGGVLTGGGQTQCVPATAESGRIMLRAVDAESRAGRVRQLPNGLACQTGRACDEAMAVTLAITQDQMAEDSSPECPCRAPAYACLRRRDVTRPP